MKSIPFIICLFVSGYIYSQEINIKATRQHWAGGACCSTGTNYNITVYGDSTELQEMKFEYIVIDGNKFDITTSSITNSGSIFKTFHFGISRNNHQEILIEELKMDENPKYDGCYLMISYNNKMQKHEINSVEELFYLAYP